MNMLQIKGISYRFDDIFYVDIKPNANMKKAFDDMVDKRVVTLEVDSYFSAMTFLNIACDISETDYISDNYNLSTYVIGTGWIDIPYECTEAEKKEIVDFVHKWRDKVPTNVNGDEYTDDTEYVWALSSNIPWKFKVLR